ncbi:glycosyltransferase family 2 protein [Sanguibacter gelidistatuariae]|nr:glycosyltransferase family 2 protein [Sanguibacter gelidistatuariae]
MPVLTFGIPVYNGEKYLPDALHSIQEQDLDDLEIIISDNGSTDGTQEICEAAAASDDRVLYLRHDTNRGGAWNYVRTVESASSPLFSWQAADDVKLATFASACVQALDDAGPEAVFACPRTQLIGADGVVFEDLDDRDLGLGAQTPHERVHNLFRSQASHVMYGVVRMSAMRRSRGLLPLVGDDMVLLVELLCQGKMALVDDQLFWQRRHAEQFSQQGENQVKWHAPNGGVRFAFPQTRLNFELHRAVTRSHISIPEKARSLAALESRWVIPRWRGMGSDVRTALGVARA